MFDHCQWGPRVAKVSKHLFVRDDEWGRCSHVQTVKIAMVASWHKFGIHQIQSIKIHTAVWVISVVVLF